MPFGRVKWFNEIKGIGVIRRLEGGDFPVHSSEILDDGFRTLFEGEIVEFEISSRRCQTEAVKVKSMKGLRCEGESHV